MVGEEKGRDKGSPCKYIMGHFSLATGQSEILSHLPSECYFLWGIMHPQ